MFCFLLVIVTAQEEYHIHGFDDQVPQLLSVNYRQGGTDWPGLCASGHFQSPVDVSSVTVVTATNSSYRPLLTDMHPLASNDYITGAFANQTAWLVYATDLLETTADLVLRHTLATVTLTTPSQHAINGQRFPLGLSLIYVVRHPDTSVYFSLLVEVMYRQGSPSALLDHLMKQEALDFSEMYPANGRIEDYFTYTGSMFMPIPDCIEGYTWVLPNYFPEASAEQIAYWQNRYIHSDFSDGYGNVRTLQSLWTREITHFVPLDESQSFLA